MVEIDDKKNNNQENEEQEKVEDMNRDNVKIWKIGTFLFMGLFLAALGYIFATNLLPIYKTTGNIVSKQCTEDLGKKVVKYINKNLVRVGSVNLVNISDRGSYCEVVTEYMGRKIPVYVTKDGKTMFLGAINLTKPLRTRQMTEQKFDAPDREVPEVQLFVMSFCPFGNQAENAMKPVVDLLGNKINIKERYIVDFVNSSIPGRTLDIGNYHIVSLHGPNEAWEDLVEVCIQKYYPRAFWNFVVNVNKECTPIFYNLTKLNNCWESIARKLNINITKIINCTHNEGIQMLLEDSKLVRKYNVMGSPTLIINGVKYEGMRTPEAFKEAICSGFKVKPKECNVKLNLTNQTTSGSCS